MIRCKFVCNSISEFTTSYSYNLSPVYASEENKTYWEATPSGSFNVNINISKGKLFQVGKEYYLDISEAN